MNTSFMSGSEVGVERGAGAGGGVVSLESRLLTL